MDHRPGGGGGIPIEMEHAMVGRWFRWVDVDWK